MPQPVFNYNLPFDEIDFRARPDLYRVGCSEQGALVVQPYESELLPHWRFRTPEIVREWVDTLTEKFHASWTAGEFVGMDMARKFLQMGFTRSRRYANHKSGRKWPPGRDEILPQDVDRVKAASAEIFHAAYVAAKDDPDYLRMKAEFPALPGDAHLPLDVTNDLR